MKTNGLTGIDISKGDSMESKYVEVAKRLVISILSAGEPTADSLYELMELRAGNKDALLAHVSALADIMTKAKEILEMEKQDGNKS